MQGIEGACPSCGIQVLEQPAELAEHEAVRLVGVGPEPHGSPCLDELDVGEPGAAQERAHSVRDRTSENGPGASTGGDGRLCPLRERSCSSRIHSFCDRGCQASRTIRPPGSRARPRLANAAVRVAEEHGRLSCSGPGRKPPPRTGGSGRHAARTRRWSAAPEPREPSRHSSIADERSTPSARPARRDPRRVAAELTGPAADVEHAVVCSDPGRGEQPVVVHLDGAVVPVGVAPPSTRPRRRPRHEAAPRWTGRRERCSRHRSTC